MSSTISLDNNVGKGAAATFGLGLVQLWDALDDSVTLSVDELALIGGAVGVLAGFVARLVSTVAAGRQSPAAPREGDAE